MSSEYLKAIAQGGEFDTSVAIRALAASVVGSAPMAEQVAATVATVVEKTKLLEAITEAEQEEVIPALLDGDSSPVAKKKK